MAEETGIRYNRWRHFCTLGEAGWVVHFFCGSGDDRLEQKTDEAVCWVSIAEIQRGERPLIPNLRWLIPMAMHGPRGLQGDLWPYIIGEAGWFQPTGPRLPTRGLSSPGEWLEQAERAGGVG